MNPKAPGAKCDECPLQDQPFVPSDGPEKAKVVICGEAPGANEVEQGKPYVGKSGKLLNKVLKFNGLRREDVFVTNSVLCRPPSNRTPTKKERAACADRLRAEIEAREPEVIIATGNAAAQAFVGGTEGITSLRIGGRRPLPGWDCDLIPTFHPAYALRNPGALPTIVSDVGRATRIEVGWEPTKFKVAANTDAAIALLEKQTKFPMLAADIEVTHYPGCCDDHPKRGTDPARFDWLCFGISHEPGKAVVYDAATMRDPRFHAALERAFASEARWVWQNGQFDIQRLWSIAPGARVDEDSMLAHFISDERVGTHDLGQLATEFLNAPNYKTEEKKHLPSKGASLAHLPLDVLYRYNATDCDSTRRLIDIFHERIAEEGVERPYRELLIPGTNVLAAVERRGIQIDRDHIGVLHADHIEREAELEANLTRWVENPRSVPQVKKAFADMGVALADTRDATISQLRGAAGKFAQMLLEYRKVAKYRSTYLDGFIKRATPEWFIHPNFKLANTETGRLACADPNVQNIPRAKDKRNVFIARDGFTLVAADYSNIEYVMAGILSGDPFICQAFIDGRNLHDELAREFLGDAYQGKDSGDEGKEQYTLFKTINFGLAYGETVPHLAHRLGVSVRRAQDIANYFWKRVPKYRAYQKSLKREMLNNGYVESLFGRKRRFPLITEDNRYDLMKEALNFPLQSSASDLTLTSLIRLAPKVAEYGAYPIITVHDQLVFEVPTEAVPDVAKIVRTTMEDTNLPLPTRADVEVGRSWGSLEAYDGAA